MSASVEPIRSAITLDEHVRIVQALEIRHREDLNVEAMRLARYRAALEEAGVEPPDDNGKELLQMVRDCAAVISTASRFTQELGSARELLDDSWVKPA